MELSTVQTILQLNNTASAYFHCGNFDEAVLLFRVALTTSRKIIVAVENDMRNNNNSNSTNNGTACNNSEQSRQQRQQQQSSLSASALAQCAPLLLRSPPVAQNVASQPSFFNQKMANSEQQQQQHDDDTTEFVYMHPILIQEQEFLNGSLSSMTFALICTFNLALALHAKEIANTVAGLPVSPTSTIRLYELSYSLLAEHEQQQQQPNDLCYENKIWLISFAILNNLGVLHKQLGSNEKSQATFEMLLSMLLYRREQYQQENSSLDEQVTTITTTTMMEGFYSNALTELGVLSQSITAASA